MAEVITQRPIKKWRDEPRLRKVPVVVCTASGTFAGNTYRLDEQRLLDALNRGFVAKALRMARAFVPLTDVEAYFLGRRNTSLASIYIQKASVLFVGERGGGKREAAAEARESRRAHLFRLKTPIRAELDVPPYTIEANIHVETWEEILESIETDNRFLPLTDVRISPALVSGESRFDFVAVNKDDVLYITESPRQAWK